MGLQPEPDFTPSFTVTALRPSSCPLCLWQPNLPTWAAFLFVFLRSLSPKLLSLLLQWVSPFSSKEHKELWPERLQVATLTRYLWPWNICWRWWFLRIWGCRQHRSLYGKDRNYYQRTKYHKVSEEEKRLYWDALAEERYSHKSQSWFGSQHPRWRRRRPEGQQPGHEPHCPGCEAPLGGTETTSTPRLPYQTLLSLGKRTRW